MENGFFLITGTSRGIGEALARKVLEKGHTVLGLARSRSATLQANNYHHLSFDLTDMSRIGQIMVKVNEIVDDQRFDFVCLVNNASAVEPIGPIEKCPSTEIESHMLTGLIAPMLLTSLFIKRFAHEPTRKKVAFISSGAAFKALPGESVYCSAKAGINMFAQCVGLEQDGKHGGFEVNVIGPGMVDTTMQLAVRSKTSEEFPLADFFKRAFAEGKLQEPSKVAEQIYELLENRSEQGKYIGAGEM